MSWPKSQASRVLVTGFDQYATKSMTSVPGASWVFSIGDLNAAGAFLATEMNGKPLRADHGAPIRLVVPGSYGCACIKWVTAISFVNDAAEATSQMQEYAAVILSLARQENPDTSAYNDPEVCLRIKRHHHAGLVLRSQDPLRLPALLDGYSVRFAQEFLAVEPPREKPTA